MIKNATNIYIEWILDRTDCMQKIKRGKKKRTRMYIFLKKCFCTGRLFLKKSYRKMTENVEVGFFLQFSQTSAKIVTTSSVTGR